MLVPILDPVPLSFYIVSELWMVLFFFYHLIMLISEISSLFLLNCSFLWLATNYSLLLECLWPSKSSNFKSKLMFCFFQKERVMLKLSLVRICRS